MIGEKIKERRLELHLTQEDLAERMGYKGKSSINKIEKGAQDIPLSKVEEFAKALHTTPDVLMGWDDTVTPVDLSDYVMIPVYGRIPAGAPKLEEEFIEDHIPIPRSWTIGGVEYGGLTVKGESMLPLIQDGDTVVYRHQPTVENGSICIARVDHYDATVKKFVQHDPRTIVLQPLNSEYDPIIFTGDSSEPSLEIIGKVVEVRHAL